MTVLAVKHLPKTIPCVLRWRCTMKFQSLFPWMLRRIWSNWLHENFRDDRCPEVQTRELCSSGFKIWGGQKNFVLVLKLSLNSYPIRIRPGKPIVHLSMAAWFLLTNILEFVRLASGKFGDAFFLSVCWRSWYPNPPMCVRITVFVPG